MHAHDRPPEHVRDPEPTRIRPAAGTRAAGPGESGLLTPAAIAGLQRAVGNRAVAAWLTRDEHAGNADEGTAVHDALRSPGKPLDDGVREDMEQRLGADFSDVRVHTGGAARRSARGLGARAYTAGSHVVIGDGGADRHTLAHELTHVVQQRTGPVAGTDTGNGVKISDPSDRFEREAEDTARRALAASVPEPAENQDQPARTPEDEAAAATIQRTTANVFGQRQDLGVGNVGPKDRAQGGVNHAEQQAWKQAERTILDQIGKAQQGAYEVRFEVDTPVCDGCRKWFEKVLHPMLAAAAGPGTTVTLTVVVGGGAVTVDGEGTIWLPEVADTHTFDRLGDAGMSLRFLEEGRDPAGKRKSNGLGLSAWSGEQKDVLSSLDELHESDLNGRFLAAKKTVRKHPQVTALADGAKIEKRLQDLTLYRGITDGTLDLTGMAHDAGGNPEDRLAMFQNTVEDWLKFTLLTDLDPAEPKNEDFYKTK